MYLARPASCCSTPPRASAARSPSSSRGRVQSPPAWIACVSSISGGSGQHRGGQLRAVQNSILLGVMTRIVIVSVNCLCAGSRRGEHSTGNCRADGSRHQPGLPSRVDQEVGLLQAVRAPRLHCRAVQHGPFHLNRMPYLPAVLQGRVGAQNPPYSLVAGVHEKLLVEIIL